MEFAGWKPSSERSGHSSGGALNGVCASEAANIIEIDNDPSENSCSCTETCDGKNSEKCMENNSGKCLDVSKLDEQQQMPALNDSTIHVSDSEDQMINGGSGTLHTSSNSDDKVSVETDIPVDLGPDSDNSVDANEKLHPTETANNEDEEIEIGKDNRQGTPSDKMVSFNSDSSADVTDLEERSLTRTDVVQGLVSKSCTSDSDNTDHILDPGTVSQQPIGDGVDGVLSVAIPADTGGATTIENKVNNDCSVVEALSDDSVICLDNDDDEDGSNSSKTKVKESSDHRNFPIYIQIAKKQSSNMKIGSISPVCPATLPNTTVAGSNLLSNSSTFLKTGSLLPNWLTKSVIPVIDSPSSNRPMLVERNKSPRAMARLLSDVGLQLVSRRVHESRVAQQKRKLQRSHGKKSNSNALDGLLSLAVDLLQTNHLQLEMRRCSCGFTTESTNVLELHYESGRESCGLQHCCLCEEYSARYPGQFVRHMELDHGRKVRVLPKSPTYLCQLCYFDTTGRAVYEKHVKLCQRLFALRSNQKPASNHSDIPIEKSGLPKPKPINCVIDVQPKAKSVSGQNEAVNSRSTLLTGERSHQQNLLRIGSHLFIVVSKPGDNVPSSSIIQTAVSHLSLINADNRPTTLTKKLALTVGQSTSLAQLTGHPSIVQATSLAQLTGAPSIVQATSLAQLTGQLSIAQASSLPQLTGQSSLKSSRAMVGLLATSVLPTSNKKAVTNDSIWASKVAAAAAKSVISQSRPTFSKIHDHPPLKTSSIIVSRLASEPSSVSPASNSATVTKLLTMTQADQLGHGSTMTSAVPSSTSVHVPPRNSLLSTVRTATNSLLPTIRTVPATTFTQVLASAVIPKTITAKCSNFSRPSASSQPNGYIICPLCSGFIKDVQALDVHMRVAHKTGKDWAAKLFRCAKCVPIKWFSTKDALFKHQLGCHNIGKSERLKVNGYCCRCEKSGISDLIEHFRQNHDTTLSDMYKSRYCSLCNMQLEGQWAFESHMTLSHENLFPSLSCFQARLRSCGPKNAETPRNSCKLCHKDDIVNLVKHMESRHQLTLHEMLRQVYCYFCSSRLQDTLGFENHMLQVHKNVFSSRDTLWDEIFTSRVTSGSSDATDGFCGAFKCSFCDDEFVSASYRYRHLVISHPRRSFVCSLCRMSCGSKQSLMRHLKLRHTRSCSVPVQRLGRDMFEKHYHCIESSCCDSDISIDLCNSPETVVITDEEDDKVEEPLLKKPRLMHEKDGLGSGNIPPESIEEVVEIDGDTVIIVQESDCC